MGKLRQDVKRESGRIAGQRAVGAPGAVLEAAPLPPEMGDGVGKYRGLHEQLPQQPGIRTPERGKYPPVCFPCPECFGLGYMKWRARKHHCLCSLLFSSCKGA